jgi:TPR repeat protein
MWHRKAAGGGNDDAKRRLGKACENGEFSLAIDLEAALTWYQKAAEGGNYFAQF